MRGAILAGGAASRFGGKPKGLEKVGGERIIDRVMQSMKVATGEEPIIVANAEGADQWIDGVTVIPDTHVDCGSLGGLHAAVAHDKSPVLVVAWDMPFVTPDLLEQIIKTFDEDTKTTLPASKNERSGVESMCAIYDPSCLKLIEAQIEDEDYRASGFLENIKHHIIPLEEFGEPEDAERLFFNVNSQDDLEKAEELWRTLRG
jgi:molybdopterin-guanine dinucleotide biosynthesis protein A